MNEHNQTISNYLDRFIREKKYLQNPLLQAKEFIVFCRKRGIDTTEEELEFFEKEKLLFPLIKIEKQYLENDPLTIWGGYSHDLLLELLEQKNIVEPMFISSHDTIFNREIFIDFYSTFQIYWLWKIKFRSGIYFNYSRTDFNVEETKVFEENDKIYLTARLNVKIKLSDRKEIPTTSWGTYKILENKDAHINRFKASLDRSKIKKDLMLQQQTFESFLKMLLTFQGVYYPFARAGSRTMQVLGDIENWKETKNQFDPQKELDKLEFTIKDIVKWYRTLPDVARSLLGVARDDWIQLWKNIDWGKKDKLEGKVRLGIEYLHWAIMLKKVLEDILNHEVLDIDEALGLTDEAILAFNPTETNPKYHLRTIRNKRLSDPKEDKNYYYDKYRRLFYLANKFGFDYQPRVVVFLEGESEERIFPEVFEWFGNKPENLGIEFVNFKGVDQLLSTHSSALKLRNLLIDLQKKEKQKILSKNKNTELNQVIKKLEDVDIVISNWTSFLSYNLNKWQMIPFFVSDDEGSIQRFLNAERPIHYDGENFNIPKEWQYLWGNSNNNYPFEGNNFEFANFNNQEIAFVLTEFLKKKAIDGGIQRLRVEKKGLNGIDPNIQYKKVAIAKKLFDNLYDYYKNSKDESIFERPIFKVIQMIRKLALFNYPPADRDIELKNRENIKKVLMGININGKHK